MGKYAEGTSVPVERSQTEINKILGKFGADQFINATSASPPAVLIGFRARDRMIKFHLPMPSVKDFGGTEVQIQKRDRWSRVSGPASLMRN